MKQKNNIDEFFKDKLENREFVIEDAFIADLESKLDQRGKVAFYWWRSLLAFLLIGSLFVAGFHYTNEGDTLADNHKEPEIVVLTSPLKPEELGNDKKFISENEKIENGNQQNRKNIIEKEAVNGNSDIVKSEEESKTIQGITVKQQNRIGSENSSIESSNLRNDKSNDTNEGRESTVAIINKEDKRIDTQSTKIERGSTLSQVGKKITGEKNTTTLVESNSKKMNEVAEPDLVVDENDELKSKNEQKEILANNIEEGATLKVDGNEKETDFGSDPIKDELVNKDEIESDDSTSENIEPSKGDIVNNVKPDSTTTELKAEIVDSIQTITKDSIASNIAIAADESKNPKDMIGFKKWNVSVFAGPTMISKKISGSENDAYYANREAGESDISTLNYGMEVGYFFNKNINLSTGVNSLTYGEDVLYLTEEQVVRENSITNFVFDTISVFSHLDTIIILDSIGTPIGTAIDSNYIDQTVTDTVITTSSDTTKKSKNEDYKNRYTYIQIPIMIGYKFRFNNFGINVKGGIVYGRLIKASGRYINADGTAVVPIKLKQNIFNIAVSTSFSYSIKKFNVFIEPKYQFNITNVFPNTATNQKYKALGVNFGIGLEF